MAEQKFENGATVKLKSGGPRMTVSGYDKYHQYSDEPQYKCRWFDAKNILTESLFTEPELERDEQTTRHVVELHDGPPPTRQN